MLTEAQEPAWSYPGPQPVLQSYESTAEVWQALREADLEEKMGQGAAHTDAVLLFVDVVSVLLEEQRRTARALSDVFVEWDPNDPRARVSPDFLLLDGQDPTISPPIWQTWLPDREPPQFALEIVSERSRTKDHELNPLRYAALGTEELAIFDPAPRVPSQHFELFHRNDRGQLLLVYKGPGPVESKVLGAWLVAADEQRNVRLARDAEGRVLIPTYKEIARAAEEQARAAEEQARAAEEQTRAEKDRREAAEAEIQKLREQLAKLTAR